MINIRRLGGCHLMLTQVYTSRARGTTFREIAGLFTFGSGFHAGAGSRGRLWGPGGVVTSATHDTWVLVKTSKFAREWTMLLPGGLGELGTTQGEH
jgi:hypothetical protein